MRRHEHRSIKEDTIVAVLHYVRAEIVRDGLDGLEHVEALLRARGVAPDARHVPRKTPKHFRRGQLRAAILRALRDSPRSGPEIAREIARETNGLTYEQVYKRVYIALYAMKRAGLVERDGRLWGLASESQPPSRQRS